MDNIQDTFSDIQQVIEEHPEEVKMVASWAGVSYKAALKGYAYYQNQKITITDPHVFKLLVASHQSHFQPINERYYKRPFIWQTKKSDSTSSSLTLEHVLDIKSVTCMADHRPINTINASFFSQLASFITNSIKACIANRNSSRWFWQAGTNRTPFFLFITELLHWAENELNLYDELSPISLKCLQARYDYISNCQDIPNLIPAADKDNVDSIVAPNTVIDLATLIRTSNL